MKKQNRLLGAVWAVVLLTSCAQETIEESVPANIGKEVKFNIGISPLSRTITVGKKTSFVEHDKLGIFEIKREGANIIASNLEYTYRDSQWNSGSSITFPLDGSAVNFYAYYPFTASVGTLTFEHQVAQDQSVEGDYDQSDLLLAKHETSTTSDTEIVLRFAHQLAMVEVAPTLPEGKRCASVAIRVRRTVTVDLVTQSVAVKREEPTELVRMKQDGNVFRAVLPAQTSMVGNFIRVVAEDGSTYWHRTTVGTDLPANRISTFAVNCGE